MDSHIAQIIFQAYQILKSDFEIGKINIPDSAKDAINRYTVVQNKVHLSESDYRNIKYKIFLLET